MAKELEARLETLRKELDAAKGTARDDLMEHLEQAVLGLEGVGAEIPAWAREMVEAHHEDEAEDGFDNMPV
ncbi:hypothetical protein KZZ07_25430 [Mameliella sp. CS4]|uniref:hypothetical protein n=1 Tax=Mameliella sp. CS4 TaxID=2862329 RepID=UPI001C5E3D66|nr:hypothetical protein [Mameliella sp. CS4]MBW4985889.1 hypothetical protein [Mameliella sp. CS4]